MNSNPAVEEPDNVETRDKTLQLVLPELLALDPHELRKIDLDIRDATTTVLGCLKRILELRPEMATLPRTDLRLIDRLRDYTHALSQAHSDFITLSKPDDGLLELVAEGTKSRKTLHAEAVALCERGLLNPKTLRSYRGIKGYRNVAFDVLLLSTVLARRCSSSEARCRFQPDELERTYKLGEAILRSVGLREANRATVTETSDRRKRAFTLFLRSYSAVRRAVIYLRWEDNDADEIAPSLYAGKMGKTRAEPVAAQAESPAPSNEAPVAELPLPARVTEPQPPGPIADRPLAASTPPKKLRVPVPGSNPFMDEGDVS